MAKIPGKQTPAKVSKPRPDFPLFPHATGRWAKKIRGRLVYFGKVSDDTRGQAALQKWLDQKDDLLAGRTPRVAGDGLSIRDLCNRFLTAKQGKLESGELSPATFADHHATCARIIKAFGPTRLVADLDASDFEWFRRSMAKGWGPVTLANEVRRVRTVFRYAEQNLLIAAPVRFGTEFKQPSRKVLRLDRAKKGPRMFEAKELAAILGKATMPLKAMILLGINCALGNSDIANLPTKAVDLKRGWLDFPRPKTGTPRRCPLWSETITATREALAVRPVPKDGQHVGLLFVTSHGGKWAQARVEKPDVKTGKRKMWSDDPVGKEFTKLLNALKLKRPGLSFYALRHTFATVASGSRDQIAVNDIMGHTAAANDMSAVYREQIDDSRLLAVTEHVRKWLFGEQEAK
ncbi:MAG: tyrosine-type recombinase/integrase [Thermoguttaceae bacterium]